MTRALSTMFLACVAVLGFAGARAAPAQPTGATAAQPQALVWLKSGDYAALERFYSQRQQDFEAGTVSDETLYAAFRQLYEDSIDNAGFFDRWVEAFPNSYAAVLSRGAFYYRMAWSVRGEKYLNQTSREQIQAMTNWLARAHADLADSLKLTAKPYLSALYLLNVALLDGTRAEQRHWYELGNSLDPANTLVRYRYMSSLRPRWGGSYGEMQEFLRQCEGQHLSPAFLARLSMLIHADRAEDAMRASDEGRMLTEWQEVIRLAEVAGEQPSTEALIGYTRAAEDLNRSADVERGLRLLADREPDDTWSAAQLGWIYARAHRDEQAWPLLVRAAEGGDPWAQFVVGNDNYSGVPALHKSPDQAAGLVWIRRSAAQCFPDALRFLETHGQSQTVDCKPHVAKRTWGANAIRWGGGALLTSLVMNWMAVSRKRTPTPEQSGRLRHPPSTLILGILVFAFFAMLAVLCNVYDNGTAGPMVTAGFVGFSALGLLPILEYSRARHELTSDGLSYGRLFGQRGLLGWKDVVRITYSAGMRWFRIETTSGTAVRISAMLTGLPEFARAVLTHVPSYAIDDAARVVLESTSRGELPTLAA